MKPGNSLMKHYLQFKDFRSEEYTYLFERTAVIKKRFKNYEKYTPLVDRTLAMIFEKASTRTRVSFEAGMYQMGGSVVHLTTGDSQLGRAEPIARDLFPLAERLDTEPWMGARPCTPDMLPVIGPAPRHRNLHFAFGHAHHGLTLAAVTGRLAAEIVCGEAPFVDPAPFSAARFLASA